MVKPAYVLALDDEPNILASLKRLLLAEPYDIFITDKPEEALQILSSSPIKVVVSDQRMPLISGVHFLKEVKEKHPDAIRILLTGQADMQSAEDAVNVGQVYRFVTKPWDPESFKGTIRKAIELHDLLLENRRVFEETKKRNEELVSINEKLRKFYEHRKGMAESFSQEVHAPLTSVKHALEIIKGGVETPLTSEQVDIINKAQADFDRLNYLMREFPVSLTDESEDFSKE